MRRRLKQHLFEVCYIIIPVCCTYACAVVLTASSDSVWMFEQYVAYCFCLNIAPSEFLVRVGDMKWLSCIKSKDFGFSQ